MHRRTSSTHLSKVPCIHWIFTQRPEFHSVSLYDQCFFFFQIQGCGKSAMHRMTPQWPQTHNCRKYLVYTEYSSMGPKFHSLLLYDQPFSRYNIVKNRKCIEWPQNDLNHLTVKSTLYTLNTHPRGPNFAPFRSRTSHFRSTSLSKIGYAPNDPRITLTT